MLKNNEQDKIQKSRANKSGRNQKLDLTIEMKKAFQKSF